METQEKLNIVCFSNQLWEYPLWTNKKHVMSRMAKLGHNVVFVDPPITTGRVFFKYLKAGNWPLTRLLSWCYKDMGVNIVTPLNYLPLFDSLSKKHAKKIQKLANKHFDPNRKTVMWIYHVEIDGIKNYIGANTFLEIGFAHVLNQKVFLYNPAPQNEYIRTELEAIKPTIINQDLKKIQ